jgi:7-carboxy-7-deazaguanine synthase
VLKFNISEIFYSLQGEATFSGLPTVFIRLVGCPLRCSYCDSEYAFYGNNILSFEQILTTINNYPSKRVCITGGEPLAHNSCLKLIDELIKLNFEVSIETSGALDIQNINPKCHIVMDIKTPSSNEVDKNLLANLNYLKPNDEVKFVIGTIDDFNFSWDFISKYQLKNVLFSPVADVFSPTKLADLILKNSLNVRLQLQLHKILWGNKSGV